MAKIKRKVKKSQIDNYKENEGGRNVDPPQPGRYKAKIIGCQIVQKKNEPTVDQLKVTYEVVDHPKYSGAYLYDYIPIDNLTDENEWKATQFEIAIGVLDPGKKSKVQNVEYDPEKQVDKVVMVRVRADSYNGEYQAKVGTVLPYVSEDDDEDEDEDLEDDLAEDDEDEDEDDDDFDEEDEDEDEDDDEDELTEEDIDEMSSEELKALMKEHSLKRPKKAKTLKAVRAFVKKSLLEEEDEEDDEVPF